LIGRADRLGSVLDHGNIVVASDLTDSVDFGTLTEQMNRHNGSCPFRHGRFNLGRIKIETHGINVDEDGFRTDAMD